MLVSKCVAEHMKVVGDLPLEDGRDPSAATMLSILFCSADCTCYMHSLTAVECCSGANFSVALQLHGPCIDCSSSSHTIIHIITYD